MIHESNKFLSIREGEMGIDPAHHPNRPLAVRVLAVVVRLSKKLTGTPRTICSQDQTIYGFVASIAR